MEEPAGSSTLSGRAWNQFGGIEPLAGSLR